MCPLCEIDVGRVSVARALTWPRKGVPTDALSSALVRRRFIPGLHYSDSYVHTGPSIDLDSSTHCYHRANAYCGANYDSYLRANTDV